VFSLLGNRRFRRLVDTRKTEYTSLDSYCKKAVIAFEVYSEVLRRGGRFLSLVSTGKPARNVIETGTWREASEKVALEKCKQSLREQSREEPEPMEREETFLVMAMGEEETEEEAEHTLVTTRTLHDNRRCVHTSTIASSDTIGNSLLELAAASLMSVPNSVSTTIQASAPASAARPTIMQPPAIAAMTSHSAAQDTRPETLFGSFEELSSVNQHLLLCQQPQLDINRRVLMQHRKIQQLKQILLWKQQLLQEQQRKLMVTKPLCSMVQFNTNSLIQNLTIANHLIQDNTISLPTVANASSTGNMARTMPQDVNEQYLRRKLLEACAREILVGQAEYALGCECSQMNSAEQNDHLQHSTRERPQSNRDSNVLPKSQLTTASEEDHEDAAKVLAALMYSTNQGSPNKN